MSKIVCDICGTTYDSAAGSCPVCGWSQGGNLDVDSADVNTDFLDDDFTMEDSSKTSAPQKGKVAFDYDAVNNRRRTAPKPAYPAAKAEEDDEDDEDEEEESGSNTFLVVILVILILALLGVSAYIGWTKILKPKQMGSDNNKPQDSYIAQDNDPGQNGDSFQDDFVPTESSETEEQGVPCTGLSLVGSMEKLTFAGQYWRLMVKAAPEDTTDTILYSSSDESVVTIDEYGRVTAVGEGETTIVITCGSEHIEVPAVVQFEAEKVEESTAPSVVTPNTPEAGTTVATPSSTLKLKRSDVTISRKGVYITLETEGGIAVEDIKWSTSDSAVATVYNGTVTALGRGTCVITAKYNGQEAECVVRCKF